VSRTNLADDVFVGEANNHAVLGGIVLVLILNTETLAGIVVGFALTTSPVLDLEPLEVLLGLDDLYKRHFELFRVYLAEPKMIASVGG